MILYVYNESIDRPIINDYRKISTIRIFNRLLIGDKVLKK